MSNSASLLPLFSTGMAILPMLEEMQHVGMPASRTRFRELSDYVDAEMIRMQERISIRYCNGLPFNPNSSDQVRGMMHDRGLKGEKLTDTGKISTAKKSIEHLRDSDDAIDDVFTYRELYKIGSTYTGPILRIADEQPINEQYPDIFTVHTKIKPVTTEPRRLSAEKPNLLNIPKRSELGNRVRKCYITPPGKVFTSHDFSSQEMRVAAHVSGDKSLNRLFRQCRYCSGEYPSNTKCYKSPNNKHKARCPHTEAAVKIFGLSRWEDVKEKEQRDPTKTANFGILYGLAGPGLNDSFRQNGVKKRCSTCNGQGFNLTTGDLCPTCYGDGTVFWKVDECQDLVNEIKNKVYPGMKQAILSIEKYARDKGYVSDLYGMKRYLPNAWSDNFKERAEAGRQAFSHVIQGTAQGMMQNAMAWVRPWLRDMYKCSLDVRVCLQVHDELLTIITPDLWDTIDPLMTEAFTEHYGLKLSVPVLCEGHISNVWGELK